MPGAARHDLRRHQPCFDFFTWLCDIKARGYTEVVFQTKKRGDRLAVWGEKNIQRRIESILRPGPTFAGLTCRDGDDGDDVGTSKFREFIETYRPGGFAFERLKSALTPITRYRYTITLRRSTQKPWRNSDEDVWRPFARDIGALVIEDYSVQPIDLCRRMAIYAGARMNFFVPSGPGHLLYFSDYPYAVFGCGESEKQFARTGIPSGEQIPWARENQRLVWETPSLASLHRYFGTLT